jgi:hypothetical protein
MQSLHERLGTAISSLLSCSKDGNSPFLRRIVEPRAAPNGARIDAATVRPGRRYVVFSVPGFKSVGIGTGLERLRSPDGPDASANLGYEDLREHRYWHYVDVPFSPDGTRLPEIRTPNAATRIAQFRQVRNDPTADARLKVTNPCMPYPDSPMSYLRESGR